MNLGNLYVLLSKYSKIRMLLELCNIFLGGKSINESVKFDLGIHIGSWHR